MIMPGEPVTVQRRMLDCPGATFAGDAVKLVMVGGFPTITVTVAVAVPKLFLAVKEYDVVAEGFTVTDVPVTVPTPALMVSVVAPVTDQLSVLD
jgi:hypothetical protein